MHITTIGIDLAKNLFQLHGIDAQGNTVLRKQLRRSQMTVYFVKLPACLIGMEACATSHYWARKLQAMGHTVRLMAPQFVKPYVKSNKNDAADAAAICEAVTRPSMRFVAIKTVAQQAQLALHRARSAMVGSRTRAANQIRGLIAELGISLPQGISHIHQVPALLDTHQQELPGSFIELITTLYQHFVHLGEQIKALETRILHESQQQGSLQRQIQQVPGIGPISASAFVASVGDVRAFKSGRELAAWLGLVPRQCSSGGKNKLLGISKRGDTYLRTLLVHGARAVVQANELKRRAGKPSQPWLDALVQRRNKNIAAVAQANKTVRILWAMLSKGESYAGSNPAKGPHTKQVQIIEQ